MKKFIVKCGFCNGTGKRSIETHLEDFGNKIAMLREARGLTQAQLGEKLGYTRTSITNIESGRQAPSIDKIYELGEILGVEPRELL